MEASGGISADQLTFHIWIPTISNFDIHARDDEADLKRMCTQTHYITIKLIAISN